MTTNSQRQFIHGHGPRIARWALGFLLFGIAAFSGFVQAGAGGGGNRLAYLDSPCDPVYPSWEFARLETPQWIGQPGVEAAIVLSIDDLREPEKHEKFLRPVLDRLKALTGRAPVSIMTNVLRAPHPLVGQWLQEGLSIEVHTVTHFCPLLQREDFAAGKKSYEDCIDQLAEMTGVVPTAVRVPCCDSMSSPSPRFFAEIFNSTTPAGRFLKVDSSIMLLFTSADASLPCELVIDEMGRPRFAKYIPEERKLGTVIENYPYPYVIGGLCWEIPAVLPSDWSAQRLNGKASPESVRDWKKAIDAVVVKRGVWALCFHPYDWMTSQQLIELIEYAYQTYPGRVSFLTFPELLQRLEENLLGGQSLRNSQGGDNGVRLLDVNGDGWMDVIVANAAVQKTRVWQPESRSWQETDFPVRLVDYSPAGEIAPQVHFGILAGCKGAVMLVRRGPELRFWHWSGAGWVELAEASQGLEDLLAILPGLPQQDVGIRLRDLDGDGSCELLVAGVATSRVYRWEARQLSESPPGSTTEQLVRGSWVRLDYALPVPVVDEKGRDAGLRLVDLDGDSDLDVVASGPERWLIGRFDSLDKGWTVLRAGGAEDPQRLPPFVNADGTNNGVWFQGGRLWIQNEFTPYWIEWEGQRIPIAAQAIEFAQLLLENGDGNSSR
jgi:hypothetical protein